MDRKWMQVSTLGLGGLALLCWVVMFLSGHDVWQHAGRLDFWNLQGPPYSDLRAFMVAFYFLLIVLSVHMLVTAVTLVASRK